MKHTTIAVDVAKSVFELAVSTRPGRTAERHRLSRARFLKFFAQREEATVLMEACGSAHHWARSLQRLRHKVLLLPPHAVRAYVPRNKTDRTDAKALLEAYRNDEIHPVPVKTVEQQTLGSLHRLRSGWLATRTARINAVRGLLREFGVTIPAGSRNVLPQLHSLLEDADSELPDPLRPPLAAACDEIRQLEANILNVEQQLSLLAKQTPVVAQLDTIPGIGLLSATALVASVGDVQRFPSARQFASYLGLTPNEHSSALRRRLGAISKRGDVYLRMLLTHGARSVLRAAKRQRDPDRLRSWALKIERHRGHNKAAVALANKLARIVWAVWKKGDQYRSSAAA